MTLESEYLHGGRGAEIDANLALYREKERKSAHRIDHAANDAEPLIWGIPAQHCICGQRFNASSPGRVMLKLANHIVIAENA